MCLSRAWWQLAPLIAGASGTVWLWWPHFSLNSRWLGWYLVSQTSLCPPTYHSLRALGCWSPTLWYNLLMPSHINTHNVLISVPLSIVKYNQQTNYKYFAIPQSSLNMFSTLVWWNSSRTVYLPLPIVFIYRPALDHSRETLGLKACAACLHIQALPLLNTWISYQGRAVFESGSMLWDVKKASFQKLTHDFRHLSRPQMCNHTYKVIPTVRIVCRSSAVQAIWFLDLQLILASLVQELGV